jgi:hypothetical protein
MEMNGLSFLEALVLQWSRTGKSQIPILKLQAPRNPQTAIARQSTTLPSPLPPSTARKHNDRREREDRKQKQ